MNIPCSVANKACLPCNDDPIANLSAEAPDVDVFISFYDWLGNPPLGTLFAQIGCKRICYSEVSQQEADDCALLQAQECTWGDWNPPQDPPLPPPPPGGGGAPDTPGGIPLPSPRNAMPTFRNSRQCCISECSNGQPFEKCQAAGTVADLSQAVANAKALALACKRANAQKICFANVANSGCVSESYDFQILMVGGTPFSYNGVTTGYIFSLFGVLPPGLSLNGDTGVISGTPTTPGVYSFEIDVFDAAGNFTSGVFTICIGDITTSTLPDANEGAPYSQALDFEPSEVTDEEWTVVSGALPPGLTLATNGALSGTPTAVGTYLFTVEASGTCFDTVIACQRTFTLEVATCSFTCLQSAVITPPASEPPYFSVYAPNVDLIFGGGGGAGSWVGSGQEAVLHVIDPATLAIVNTVNYPVDEVPTAGVYDPGSQRLIIAFSFNLGADTVIRVINPSTLVTEDSTVIGSQTGPHALALDTVNNRVYIGFNVNFPVDSLYAFDLTTHVATQIATGNTTLGAVAYSPEDDLIFCALDSGTISVFEAATMTLVGTLTVTAANAIELTYSPTSRCLYAGLFPTAALRVWELDSAVNTSTTLNFTVPGTGSDVQVTVGSTAGMLVGHGITIDGFNYTIASVDSATEVTVTNINAVPATLVVAPVAVATQGIVLFGDIVLPENPSGVTYDPTFDRIVTGANVAQSVRFVDPGLQALSCSVFLGTRVVTWNNLGNSGCQLFIPTNNFPAFPTIPTDNLYHVII